MTTTGPRSDGALLAGSIAGVPLTIADGIGNFARAQPTAVAVIDGDRRLTCAELDDRASRLAQVLLASLPEPGARVAVLLGNRLEYAEVAAGIARAGLVMVPLNPRMTAAEAAYVVDHSRARAIVLDEALSGLVDGLLDRMAAVLTVGTGEHSGYERQLAEAGAEDPAVQVDERDPFCGSSIAC